MATNFSPCKGSYVLNQFPSNVMFAMNGFMYQPVERYRAIMALLFSLEAHHVFKSINSFSGLFNTELCVKGLDKFVVADS